MTISCEKCLPALRADVSPTANSNVMFFAAVAIERLAGLQGGPVTSGLYLPHQLIDPSYTVAQLRRIGTTIKGEFIGQ